MSAIMDDPGRKPRPRPAGVAMPDARRPEYLTVSDQEGAQIARDPMHRTGLVPDRSMTTQWGGSRSCTADHNHMAAMLARRDQA